MPVPSQVQNLSADQDSGNILLSWDGISGATTYQINRGTDGVAFTALATVSSTVIQYLDSLPGTGVTYFYQVAGVNGTGTGTYSASAEMVAAPPAEMSLFELRLRSQQTADRINSQFVDKSEWNSFIRLAANELYDLLVTSYEDYYLKYCYISTTGTVGTYALPDGVSNYLGGTYGGTSGTPASAFYKLAGVDLGVNTLNNSWVTINRFDFIDRNRYVYPNSNSSIYGVFNMRYRVTGSSISFIPMPSGGQQVRLWYVPRLPQLLADTDITTIGISGWLRYVIVRSAKYALDKEEGSDTSNLSNEILFLKQRIEQAAQNRDVGQAETISETRKDGGYLGNGWGAGGGNAGW